MKKLLSLACVLGLFVGSVAIVGCSNETKKETKRTETTTSTGGGDKEKSK